jgi:hypothetical protein
MEHFVELPHDDSAPSRPRDFFRVAARVTQPRNWEPLLLKKFFDRIESALFPKTSGSKGLQVYVPLNGKTTYDGTKAFARVFLTEFCWNRLSS